MDDIRILDVTGEASFGRIPPCADPGFDHRSCDYWEDAVAGSKAARLSWLTPAQPAEPETSRPTPANPFLADLEKARATNPFAAGGTGGSANPFLAADDTPVDNPFAPVPATRPNVAADAPRKLQLLARGLGVVGSYAKILERDGVSVAYCQFGPLTAYPRAQRTRDLYPALPVSPLPAVITCIATTREARREGLAKRLIEAVCRDLAGRGFAAVEVYPEVGADPDATSAASPGFWEGLGFVVAAADERFPVLRRELE